MHLPGQLLTRIKLDFGRADTAESRSAQQPEKLSGLLTVLAIAAGLVMANSPLEGLYGLVHHTRVAIRVGELMVSRPLMLWINEGLMVFFFLLVALESKREALEKQTGIFAAAWLAVRLGIARLPAGATWMRVYGAALMAGIGFTMGLFFAAVVFGNQPVFSLSAKIGVLAGSLASAVLGALFLLLATPRRAPTG